MIRPVVRLAAIVLGLAAVVYGSASLTGGWLGTPPWSTDTSEPWLSEDDLTFHYGDLRNVPKRVADLAATRRFHDVTCPPLPGAVVATTGLALAAFGAWPRRRRSVTAP